MIVREFRDIILARETPERATHIIILVALLLLFIACGVIRKPVSHHPTS